MEGEADKEVSPPGITYYHHYHEPGVSTPLQYPQQQLSHSPSMQGLSAPVPETLALEENSSFQVLPQGVEIVNQGPMIVHNMGPRAPPQVHQQAHQYTVRSNSVVTFPMYCLAPPNGLPRMVMNPHHVLLTRVQPPQVQPQLYHHVNSQAQRPPQSGMYQSVQAFAPGNSQNHQIAGGVEFLGPGMHPQTVPFFPVAASLNTAAFPRPVQTPIGATPPAGGMVAVRSALGLGNGGTPIQNNVDWQLQDPSYVPLVAQDQGVNTSPVMRAPCGGDHHTGGPDGGPHPLATGSQAQPHASSSLVDRAAVESADGNSDMEAEAMPDSSGRDEDSNTTGVEVEVNEANQEKEGLFKARHYQMTFYRMARRRNIVAFLDTGSGKTFISVLLIKYMGAAEKQRELNNLGKRRAIFFLVPKKVLVGQQAQVIRTHSDLRVGEYCSDGGHYDDGWDGHAWSTELCNYDVFVMTPQILLNMLRHGFISMGRICLICFDECHHARKKHPYNLIMQEFYHKHVSNETRPKIFGMTASLVDKKSTISCDQGFVELQQNLNAIIITANVGEHASRAVEKGLPYNKSTIVSNLKETDSLMNQALLRLQMCNHIHLLKDRRFSGRNGTTWYKPEVRKKLPCDHKIRQISGLRYVLQEMGLLAAILGLTEMLEEETREISESEKYSREIRNRARSAEVDRMDVKKVGAEAGRDLHYDLSKDRPEQLWSTLQCPGGMFAVAKVIDPAVANHSDLQYDDFRNIDACKTKSWWDLVEALALGVFGCRMEARNFVRSAKESSRGPPFKSAMARAVRALRNKINMALISTEVPRSVKEGASPASEILVTHKTLQLFRFLMSEVVERGCLDVDWRGMVFVEQTITAVVLEQMVRAIPELNRHYRCQSLTGHSGAVMATAMEDKHQRRIVKLFRDGQVNLLVSTSVAEEGLDITDCRLVIRFDLPKTEAAYIQSRGRARNMNSVYVMFVELNNPEMMEQINHLREAEESMKKYAQKLQNMFGNKEAEVGEDFISGSEYARLEMAESGHEDAIVMSQPDVLISESGSARLTADAAVALVHRYCSQLPQDQYCSLAPHFIWCTERAQYQVQIMLPSNSPLTVPIIGPWMPSKREAKAAVCLLACRELQKLGELDENLLPSIVSEKEVLKNNTRQLREEARKAYNMEWRVFNPINPKILQPTQAKSEEERVAKGIQNMDLDASHASNYTQNKAMLHLHIAELVSKATKSSMDSDAVVPERIGFLTQRKITKSLDFKIFPEKSEVDVSVTYCGPFYTDGNDLRLLKAYHFAVMEGAYFKGKLFSTICSECKNGTFKDDDFYSEITPTVNFLSLRTGQTNPDPKGNTSWYLLVPLLSRALAPFMETLGEMKNVLRRRNIWESSGGGVHEYQHASDWQKSPNMPSANRGYGNKGTGKAADHIDWDFLKLIAKRVENLKQQGIKSLSSLKKGAVIMASHNPCVYKVLGVRNDLNLTSQFPADPSPEFAECKDFHEEVQERIKEENPKLAMVMDTPVSSHNSKDYACFNDYYKDRYDLHDLNTHQPLIECISMRNVSILKRARNFLRKGWHVYRAALEDLQEAACDMVEQNSAPADPVAKKPPGEKHGYGSAIHVVPELMVIHPLHWNFWQSLSVFVAVSWMFESLLKVGELGEVLCESQHASKEDEWLLGESSIPRGISTPDTVLIFEAVTSRQCQEYLNYERLEFIGDALLKYVASMYLYWEHPTAHEGLLTKKREALVSNLKLAKACVENGLHRYMRHVRLGDHPWKPPGCQFLDSFWEMINGDPKGGATWYGGRNRQHSEENAEHQKEAVRVKFKTLADVVEALIGAFYTSGGMAAGVAIIDRLGLVSAKFMMHAVDGGDEWLGPLMAGPDALENRPEIPQGFPSFIASSRGKQYKNTHDLSGLERVLGYRIKNSKFFMEALTHCSWQESDPPCYQRLEYLGDAVLDVLVTKHMFDLYGDTNPGVLTNLRQATVNNERLAIAAVNFDIQKFLLHHSSFLQAHITDFVEQLERLDDRAGTSASYGFGERQAPKVLGDIIESLIGATYLDVKGSLEKTWSVWQKLLQPFVSPETVPMHPVRELLEVCQSHGFHVEFQRRPSPNASLRAISSGRHEKQKKKKTRSKEQSGDDGEISEDEEDQFDLEAEVLDGVHVVEQSDAPVNFQLEKSGKRAVSDSIEEPSDPDIYVVVMVDGKVKGEGLGNHIRAARREAARSALEGEMAQYARTVKQNAKEQIQSHAKWESPSRMPPRKSRKDRDGRFGQRVPSTGLYPAPDSSGVGSESCDYATSFQRHEG